MFLWGFKCPACPRSPPEFHSVNWLIFSSKALENITCSLFDTFYVRKRSGSDMVIEHMVSVQDAFNNGLHAIVYMSSFLNVH